MHEVGQQLDSQFTGFDLGQELQHLLGGFIHRVRRDLGVMLAQPFGIFPRIGIKRHFTAEKLGCAPCDGDVKDKPWAMHCRSPVTNPNPIYSLN